MVTQAELKEILHYNEETGIFTWKVRRQRIKPGQVAGRSITKGYVQIGIKGKVYLAHRLAWFYVYGKWPTNQIDHENQNPSNNWIKNLREVTNRQNGQNKCKRVDNASGVTGVHFNALCKKWVAQIRAQDKRIFLGYFATVEAASQAYTEAQAKYHSHRPI